MDGAALIAAHRAELARLVDLMAREHDLASEQLRLQVAELINPSGHLPVAAVVAAAVATTTKAGADAALHLRGLVHELAQHEHSAANGSD